MLGVRHIKAQDLHGLSPEAVAALVAQLLERVESQARELDSKQQDLEAKQQGIESKKQLIQRKDRGIAWRDAKLEKIVFELARLKRRKFGAGSGATTSDQRQLFQAPQLGDEDDLESQLAALQAALPNKQPVPRVSRKHPRQPGLVWVLAPRRTSSPVREH